MIHSMHKYLFRLYYNITFIAYCFHIHISEVPTIYLFMKFYYSIELENDCWSFEMSLVYSVSFYQEMNFKEHIGSNCTQWKLKVSCVIDANFAINNINGEMYVWTGFQICYHQLSYPSQLKINEGWREKHSVVRTSKYRGHQYPGFKTVYSSIHSFILKP